MIHEADSALQQLILNGLMKESEWGIQSASRITFSAPSEFDALAVNAEPTVNLYLYDVRENLKLRDDTFHVNRDMAVRETNTTGVELMAKKRSPVLMDLSYIVTAHCGNDTQREHRLLADVLMILLREPFISSELVPGTGGSPLPLSVAQPDHPVCSDPVRVWRALGSRMRPSLSIMTTVPIDPYNTVWTRVVREAVLQLRDGIDQENPGAVVISRSTRVSAAGTVIDAETQLPIEGAKVTHADPERYARTDARGFFYFLDIPPGPISVTISKPGYEPQTVRAVSPPPGQANNLDPFLARMQPIGLPGHVPDLDQPVSSTEQQGVPKEGAKSKPSRASR